ncbi:hypothetical protein JGUZn3_20020 [Entomobacter blattae]|uniref:Uncharacterized protein n=1 Tax=Entomobacter blattae TaxID=2762277 RepID=A0A7H1NTU7_9PROT|nr:hypothetical protein JGUZn3_20020 [Entomobacter blattae]
MKNGLQLWGRYSQNPYCGLVTYEHFLCFGRTGGKIKFGGSCTSSTNTGKKDGATTSSINNVSVAPQIPTRRILAFSKILRVISNSALIAKTIPEEKDPLVKAAHAPRQDERLITPKRSRQDQESLIISCCSILMHKRYLASPKLCKPSSCKPSSRPKPAYQAATLQYAP